MRYNIKFALVLLICLHTNLLNACTIFSCARNGEVFAGANEDDYTPFSRVWFNPATKERFGSVCFGAPDMQAASAMNEYGLFFDFAGGNFKVDPKGKPEYNSFLLWDILGKCKTVKEAMVLMDKYAYTSQSQVMIADAGGNSVVVSPSGTFEKHGDNQVNSNCNMLNGKLACMRPEMAKQMLAAPGEISVDYFKNILQATHQEGKLTTLYSTVYDLKRGILYVYFFHNYDVAYTIDLKAELKKGYRIENLADHFPKSFAYEEFSENNGLYLKESIFREMEKNDLDSTIDKYVAADRKVNIPDSILDPALLEVALQLIKYANNEHAAGGSWDYFFSLSKGYDVAKFTDKRLTAAERLLLYLSAKNGTSNKLRNFIYELYAYLKLVDGNVADATLYYQKAIADPAATYSVSLLRANEMLKRLKD